MGLIEYEPPFNRSPKKSMELAIWFDKGGMYSIIKNEKDEKFGVMHFLAPCTYDIEREVKFRMGVSAFGIHAFGDEPLIKEYM